jgi:hypothetical protein
MADVALIEKWIRRHQIEVGWIDLRKRIRAHLQEIALENLEYIFGG